MAIPDTETILAAVGLVLTAAVWAVERFLPGRKRIGYRIQMDAPIAMNPPGAEEMVQLRLLRNEQEIDDAMVALIRVENVGSKDIVRHDYQEPLLVEFPGRTIIEVQVTETNPTLRTILTRNSGLQPDGSRITLPRVPLNRRDHFKLLVLLSGSGDEVTMGGFISGGSIVHNTARTSPRKWTLALGTVFVILMGLLAGLLVRGSDTVDEAICASGQLAIEGSSAFAKPMKDIAEDYQKQCPDADITVRSTGSLNGLKDLAREGRNRPDRKPSFIAMTDVEAPHSSQYENLKEARRVSIVPLSVVVNKESGVNDLTLDKLRDIYSGKMKYWPKSNGDKLPITVVTRDSQSGTRITFEETLLNKESPATPSTADCGTLPDGKPHQPQGCEASDTDSVVDTVDKVAGAIGYAETQRAGGKPHVVAVSLDGNEPVLSPNKRSPYPFWAVERLYTYGEPTDGTLIAKFLAFMNQDSTSGQLNYHKHIPCNDVKVFYERYCNAAS
ncbi:substrate-binding domain-containing protein [Streptomyces sp. 796.1]|uniref:substrate-binding domain-containing protein n=1 Tax=Streptomyces sp. 796.1 TaxID=3163029 RepID=UPI0039C949CB